MSSKTIFLLTIFIFSTNAQTEQVAKQDTKHCGEYGFRCINKHEYEICPDSSEQDATLTNSGSCLEDMHCDEESPSFCSLSESDDTKCDEKAKRRVMSDDDDDDYRIDEPAVYKEHNDINLNFMDVEDGENECELEHASTTETPDALCKAFDVDIAKMFSNPHDCERIGYFPDNSDKTLFYYCDVETDGATYTMHHMKCDRERVFDPINRECVLIGSTRNI